MTLRDDIYDIMTKPQYSLTIWAIIIIVLTGTMLLCYTRQVMLEIDTNSNLIEAASRY